VRFSDDGTPGYYYRAFTAGIINGTGLAEDGAVIPGRGERLDREQIAKMLYRALVFCRPDAASGLIGATAPASFTDGGDVSDWAVDAAAFMASCGILKGTNGRLLPKEICSFEQAAILAKRVYEKYQTTGILLNAPMLLSGLPAPVLLSPSDGDASMCIQDGVTLKWLALPGASQYLVRLDLPGETQTQVVYTAGTELQVQPRRYAEFLPGMMSVSIVAVDGGNTIISPVTRLDVTLYNDPNYYFDFKSAAEAAKYMTTIKVNVWDFDSSGVKVTKTMPLTVHKWVADDVAAIFDEIYNGPEQFPIHTLGGYRAGTGEHGKGTAVDINWDETYEIYADGRIGVGACWLPGENPYSIPLDGDVVRAFRAHGWGWGGTDWSKKHDYMHFSYFGT
jgi:hypothetical protein